MRKKKPVDHRARRREIITNSVALFARDGYERVTFLELAGHCGISRTILYRYFKNKRQIFDAAIIQLSQEAGRRCMQHFRDDLPAADRIRRICEITAGSLLEFIGFVSVTVDFLSMMKRANHNMSRPILRFTIGFRRMLHTQIVRGIRNGEFRTDADPRLYTDLLYSVYESAVIRLLFAGTFSVSDVMRFVEEILKGMKK